MELKKCALCGLEKKLELSHIVPKMAIRTLKKTAIGSIRNTENPNIPVQDSEKHYMLCGDCEDLFSETETYFANNVFHPYLNKEKIVFNYDERLFYFLTSVSWRSLYWDLLDFVENHVVSIDALECLISCEGMMREYLLHKRENIGNIENHIFFFDEIRELNQSGDFFISGTRPHATIHRGISSYTFCSEEFGTYGTMTNMLGIIIFTLYRLGDGESWKKTKIIDGVGCVEARNQEIRSVAGKELAHLCKVAKSASEKMSEKQHKKVLEKIEKVDKDAVKNSPIYKDLISDRKISGTEK